MYQVRYLTQDGAHQCLEFVRLIDAQAVYDMLATQRHMVNTRP